MKSRNWILGIGAALALGAQVAHANQALAAYLVQQMNQQISTTCSGQGESCWNEEWLEAYGIYWGYRQNILGISPCTAYPGGCAQRDDDLETVDLVLWSINQILNS